MNRYAKIALLCLCFASMPLLLAPRNGSGTYTLPAGNPVVTGTTISSTVHNNTNSDIATALTNSIAKDGQTTPTANLPMGTFRHTGVGNATARNHYATVDQVQDGDYIFVVSVAGTNTITGTLTPSITAYVPGMHIILDPANANTGATTLALNGLTALDVLKGAGQAIIANDLRVGVPALLVLDTGGDDWILLNPFTETKGAITAGTLTGDFVNVNNTLAVTTTATLAGVSLRDAAILNTGTLANARLDANMVVGTSLTVAGTSVRDAGILTSGTIAAARLPGSFNGFANPTASVGLSAVNGSAATAMRSDGAPALDQSIAPTWTGLHSFTKNRTAADEYAALFSSNNPFVSWRENDAAADNRRWLMGASSEQWCLITANDTEGTQNNVLCADRTGATVDQVAFPTLSNAAFLVGKSTSAATGAVMQALGSGANAAIRAEHATSTTNTIVSWNQATSGDNKFVSFGTEGSYTERGSIDYNRGGTATRYNTTSDERLKTNIRPAPSARGLINSVPIEQFDWKETGVHVSHGLVAQHLNKVAPDCVSRSSDAKKPWQVEKACLVPAMIKVIQEQDVRIAQLEAAEVGLLIKEVQELRARVQNLEAAPQFITFPSEPAANRTPARGSIQYNRSGGRTCYNHADAKCK